MNGVGSKLIDALRREATHGDADRYALRRLSKLIDALDDVPEARPVIASAYHHALAVAELRERLAVVE